MYSYTRLSIYKQCPYRYKLKYVEKIPEDIKTIEQLMGSLVHKALERLYKNLISAKTTPLDRLLEYYNKRWDKVWDNTVKVVKQDLSTNDYRELGEKCIKDYYESYYPFNQSKTIAVEKRVSFSLDEDRKCRMTGFIDRLAVAPDGTYEVHDYKTSGSLPTQKEKDEDKQLALYHIGVKEMWKDVKSVKLIWHYLVFGKEISSSRTDEEIERVRAEKIAIISELEAAAEFPPYESVLCSWCSYQSICPLRKHLFIVEQLPEEEKTKEEGAQLVDKLDALQSVRKSVEDEIEEIKEKLLSYSEREGVERIFGTDKVAKIKKEIKISFPDTKDERRPQLEGVLKEEGKWEEVSSLNTRGLEKVIREKTWDGDIIDRVEVFADKEERKSVTLVKKKDKDE
ncbi:MAG TPA: PD-(D/E)XK nuclease family protein [Thermodesulfobacteriota bacterium]|nr:PD-(D/E)XK nuclease family protein [Thermodesulfobacteriota bacterium]